MLGELYKPRGKAREHAQIVLETEEPHAVNPAFGCSLGCDYCYGPLATRQSRENWRKVRLPKKEPAELVRRQLDKGLQPEGVFISFLTEPFLPNVRTLTEPVIKLLTDRDIRVATSSKVGLSSQLGLGIRHGMTVISLDQEFCQTHEPRAPPPQERIAKLHKYHKLGEYTWISMEPCPCSAIWQQNILDLLKEVYFVDLIVKGKWNYDKRCNTEEAKQGYAVIISQFEDFCKEHGIKYHIKSDTLRFIGDMENE